MKPLAAMILGLLFCSGSRCLPLFPPPYSQPDPSPTPLSCTEEDLADLWYEDSVVAGNAARIVFERFGYPVSGCLPDGYTFTPSTSESPTAQFYPAERTLVTIEVPSLLRLD